MPRKSKPHPPAPNLQPLDILVLAPHPDDAELLCAGLLLKAKAAGKRTGVIDITRGEMGTRGSVEERQREADAASKLLRLDARENLGLPDGHLYDDERLRTEIVRALRKYRPSVLLVPHWEDQHPDHAAVGQASLHAAWLCGAPNYDPTSAEGIAAPDRPPYRPRLTLHYNNRYLIRADVVIDVSDVFEEKMKVVACFDTQFGPGKKVKKGGHQTRLSSQSFVELLRGMHAYYGYQSGVQFGEAYCVKGPLPINNISAIFG